MLEYPKKITIVSYANIILMNFSLEKPINYDYFKLSCTFQDHCLTNLYTWNSIYRDGFSVSC